MQIKYIYIYIYKNLYMYIYTFLNLDYKFISIFMKDLKYVIFQNLYF